MQLPKAIESVTGARVKQAELQVSGLEDGSFVEDLKIKLLFKTKEDYEQCVNKVADTIKTTWEGGTPMLKVAIGVLIGALLIGSLNLLPSDAPSDALSTIQGDNNAVIVIGAEAYQTSPEDFQKAIDIAISKTSQKRAVQAALDATAPAREQGAAVEFEGESGAVQVLSKEGAASLPKNVDVPDTSEDAKYAKVKLKLRASDYDSAVKGWAGTIPGVVDNRTRVMFASDLEAGKAAFKPEVDADVIVTYTSPLHQRAVLILVERVY
ncbi:hypothetical protein ACFONC_10120 [Luteimonas soli]|uniref:Acriflavin resistance protein n=1 Tax=Luteimonas soli TaxID=1648966 RepID=A0ABV7XKD7_9GAMM